MGFWSRLLGKQASTDITSSLELFREVYGGGREAYSGKTVNLDVALEDATTHACMRVITEGVAQVSFHLIQETGGRRTTIYDGLGSVLYRRPNSWQTSFEFRETIMMHLLLAGNAYVFVNRVGSAREIRELIPIEPRHVQVKRYLDLTIEYTVTLDNGQTRIFGQDAIWHLKGPSWNSWMGLDAIKMARNAIGLSATLEQGQAEFQKNGARPSANYAVTEKLSPERFEFLSKWLDRHQPGGDRYGKPVITDSGAKFTAMMMSATDQQLLETRKHQVEDVCRRFRVMPIMVGQSDKAATYASAEQMFLAHVVHTLMPWYNRIEQSADVNLLSEEQRNAGFYTKLNPNALMRGAAKDRAEYYAKGLGSGNGKGWLTQNDVRDFEDMDRSDDPKADELPQPSAPTPGTPPTDPASKE
jgi:HK97 family phage portal protein